MRSLVLAAAIAPLCVACTDESPETTSAGQSRAPAVEVLGEPVNCILVSRIRNTRVHDDFTIDFVMTGGDIYRNTLPHRCPQLGFEERFGYEASTGNLCAIDMISVIQSGAAGHGPRCQLGQFVPVRYVEPDTPAAGS
ncbi:MAG TPA: hypothetical protein VFS49_11280 [Croceibacterium sp.]|nr:hypothetical protein [Croceibacterium sp.]